MAGAEKTRNFFMDKIGNGDVGGKASGFLKARELLSSRPDYDKKIFFPRTLCVATDIYDEFIKLNKLEKLLSSCASGDFEDFHIFKEAVLNGKFPPELEQKFCDLWDTMNYPLAVRSSSLLEDMTGTSFAGKYATVFISNYGNHEERWLQLTRAIKFVFASIGHPNAIEYRRKHGYLGHPEKMAVMIQRAVGQEYKGYFFPLLAGVGFSQNGYCWHSEVKKEDGLVRMVFGLGTRAVGRGYARLFSPGNPTSRPEGHEAQAIDKYSQATMDVLDIKSNELKSIHFSEVVQDGFEGYPGSEKFFSLRDDQTIYVPATRLWDPSHKQVLTFDAILSSEWAGVRLPHLLKSVMQELERGFGCSIDMEFAGELVDDEFKLSILQTRPLTQRENHNPRELPVVGRDDVIVTAERDVPTGFVEKIEYIIYVDSAEYFLCPIETRYTVARIVGHLNKALHGKRFILVGPGRWGSSKTELGVPAKYAEICNAQMLIEVAGGKFAPEVSFGTHFFQDLIEDGILYVPVFPDEPNIVFNLNFFQSDSCFEDILTSEHDLEFEKIIKVIHVPTVCSGKFAHAVLNGITEKGIVFIR